MTLPGGIIKYTNEGIHGPEVQYLGRSAPLTTGVVPLQLLGGVGYGLSTVDKMPDERANTG